MPPIPVDKISYVNDWLSRWKKTNPACCWLLCAAFLTVRAWSASHSCGEWILWTSRVTAIWGLQEEIPDEIMFSWADWKYKKTRKKQPPPHILWVFYRHTPLVPCWSDRRSLWCTPSPPVYLLDGWLYLLEKDIYTNLCFWRVIYNVL